MRDNQMPNWLDDLISSESKVLSKKAQAEDKMDEISKRIDEAETPEELAAIEKELNELEQSSKDDDSDAKAATDESDDNSDSSEDSDEDQDEQNFENDVDLSDIMKEVKDLKDNVDDKKEKLEEKIVNQLEQLNDQIGLNKIVDLNSTVDTGM